MRRYFPTQEIEHTQKPYEQERKRKRRAEKEQKRKRQNEIGTNKEAIWSKAMAKRVQSTHQEREKKKKKNQQRNKICSKQSQCTLECAE